MTIYKIEEIPQGVIDDIADHFQSVVWENYGKPITIEIQTRKSNYNRIIAENVEGVVLDAVTFEPKTVVGTKIEHYLVRGIFTDDIADIYAVIYAGNSVANYL